MKIKSIITAAATAVLSIGCMAFMPQTEIFEPMTAEAAIYGDYLTIQKVDEDEDGNYDYIEIYDCDEWVTEIEIPSVIDGLPVTSIGDGAFYDHDSLTSITIPNSVASIGYSAFEGCDYLTSVTIPDSVTSIGDYAFMKCESLTSITIPDSIVSIGQYAFYSTPWLEAKQIENPLVVVNSILIDGRTCLGNVVIPDNVTSIGYNAFCHCDNLTSIMIPDSVTSIGSGAFYDCEKLESVIIENPECEIFDSSVTIPNITEIYGYKASTAQLYAKENRNNFVEIIDGNNGLIYGEHYSYQEIINCKTNETFIIIPEVYNDKPVTSIGALAFSNCKNLESITISDKITYIASNAFLDCSIKNLTIADGAEQIKSEMIVCKDTLKSVSLPDGVTVIEDEAFYACKSLESISVPDSVTRIGDEAFCNCTSLNNITIPDGVASIGKSAFSGCTGLTGITIPDSVESIGESAFSGCTSLTDITIPDSVVSIGAGAFSNTALLNNQTGAKYADKWLVICGDADITSVEIKEGTKGIADGVFRWNESLESITIPDSVTYIHGGMFSECHALKEVKLSNNITSLVSYFDEDYNYGRLDNDYGFFENCKSLESITIPDSVTNIGNETFYGCENLENVIIGNAVTSIGTEAFYGCNKLSEITIPETVETIGTKALGYTSNGEKISSFKIYGTVDTAAESYALENGFTFIDVDSTPMVSKTELVLDAGESYLLEVKNFDSEIVWGSNDTAIATVNNGLVSAIAEGETVVYAIIGESVLKCNVIVNSVESDTTTTTITDTTTTSSTVLTTITSITGEESSVTNESTADTTSSDIIPDETTTSTTVSISEVITSTTSSSLDSIATTTTECSEVSTTITSATSEDITSDTTSSNAITDETTIDTSSTTTVSETTAITVTTTSILENIEYLEVKENNGTIIIINCEKLVVNVVVPEKIDDMEVSKINDYAFSSEDIETITFNNPDVEIADSETTINEDAVIYGYWDSTAHDYAKKYNREFVSLDEAPEGVTGDANGDGKVNVRDAAAIASALAKGLNDTLSDVADFNGDGKVNVRDAAAIASALAKGEL